MKYKYQFEEKDYAYYVKGTNKKYNYICLSIFTIFYFGSCLDLLTTNYKQVFISYLFSLGILFFVLKFFMIIYTKVMVRKNSKQLNYAYGEYEVEVGKEEVILKLKDRKFELKYKDVYRVSKNEKWLALLPEDGGMMFLFLKRGFKKPTDYQDCTVKILTNYKNVKEGRPIKVKEKTKDIKKERNKKRTK